MFACDTVSHMTEVRRLTLEAAGSSRGIFGADYSVEVVWIDDETLHTALLDYCDSDDMGQGMDIREPTRLLEWLGDDRFLGERERFVAHRDLNGAGISEDPQGPASEPNLRGVPLTWTDDTPFTHHGPCGDTPACYQIGDWQDSLLSSRETDAKDAAPGSGSQPFSMTQRLSQ